MEALLEEVVKQLKKTILFLDKLKVNKAQKNEKESIVEALKQLCERCDDQETYDDVGGHHSKDKNSMSEETYDDVQCQENYDDVEVRRETEDESGGIYDDTSLTGDTYDDVSVQPKEIGPIECEKLTKPFISDYLEVKRDSTLKMLLGAKTWQKRWCVLHGNVFYMYDSAKDKRQKDAFDLTGFKFQARDTITKETKRKDRCFELKNDNMQKTYEICASDKDTMSKWHTVLKNRTKCGSVSSSNSALQETYDDVEVATGSDSTKKKKGINLPTGWGLKKTKPSEAEDENTYDETQTGEDIYEETGEGNYDDTPGPVIDGNYDDTEFPAPPTEDDDGDFYEEYEGEKAKTTSRDSLPLPPTPNKIKGPRHLSTNNELPPLPPSIKPVSSPTVPSRNETESASGTFSRDRPPMPIPVDRSSNKRVLPPPPLQEEIIRGPSPSLPPPITELSDGEEIDNLDAFGDDKDDYENMYQGMWDCRAEEGNELQFKRGEVIRIISRDYENYGWWTAESQREDIGLVPVSYLMKAYDI